MQGVWKHGMRAGSGVKDWTDTHTKAKDMKNIGKYYREIGLTSVGAEVYDCKQRYRLHVSK